MRAPTIPSALSTCARRGTVAAVACLALTGCGTGAAQDPDAAAPGEATHTMPDGTVMEGPTHVHDDSHHHGEDAGTGPSAVARMVCGGQVVDDVTRIMGLTRTALPRSSWSDPVFRCTFDLPQGLLVLTVHDADDEAGGLAHFQQTRTSEEHATPLKGVYSLGLPAYETADGTVSFVKDGKTLRVDASGLPARRLGAEEDLTRTGIAYAVATSVLTCWTEHG